VNIDWNETPAMPSGANGNGSAMPDDDFFAGDSEPPTGPEEKPAAATLESIACRVTSEWFTKAPPARAWLLRDARRTDVDGVLPLGKVGQLVAAGGVGKTMLLCQLALAVASCSRWLDTFSVPPEGKGRVLLVLGEEDAEEVQRRIYNAQRGRLGAPGDGDVVVLPLHGVPCALLERDENGNARETGFLHALRDYLVREAKRNGLPWKLIVIDPLSRFGGPDAETDNAGGTRFIQVLESLAKLTGATVLFSHHTNKLARRDGAEVTGADGRGSSSLFDGARWEASLSHETVKLEDPETRDRLGELVTLAFTKSNYSRRAEPVKLRRDVGGPLIPLDDGDRELVAQAKDTKGKKDEARTAEKATERAEDEQALLDLLAKHPKGLLSGEIRALMPCPEKRADRAAARCVTATLVRTEKAPSNGKRHFLAKPIENKGSAVGQATEGQ
jgi:RecA-family ATPase